MKFKLLERYRIRSMLKEAFDNLPSGVCYFDQDNIPIFVNQTMHSLMFSLTGQTIQSLSEMEKLLAKDTTFTLPDQSAWTLQKRKVGDPNQKYYTEVIATNVKELHQKKAALEKRNEEQEDIMRRLENITANVVSITRNEEILAMKMRIHNELGYALGATRRFYNNGCLPEEKEEYLKNQRRMAKILLGEIGNTDEADVYEELKQNAKQLGMEIVNMGQLPTEPENRELLAYAVRECLTNTIRHAGGDKVYVGISRSMKGYCVKITNNGRPPQDEIVEGGGLTNLRRRIEEGSGTLTIYSKPEFAMRITLNKRQKGRAL